MEKQVSQEVSISILYYYIIYYITTTEIQHITDRKLITDTTNDVAPMTEDIVVKDLGN